MKKYALLLFCCFSLPQYGQAASNTEAAGAILGTASSFYFTESYPGFSITPSANNGAYSLEVSKQW